jgi:uncharacterized membrane protein YdjX (TVP38/TMEM64 family)
MIDRRLVRGAVILIALAATGAAVYLSPLGRNFDPARLAETVRAAGGTWWAIPLYLLAYAILDLLFIPTQFLSIAAVLIWGWKLGGTIELISATAGAIPPYLIARTTLRGWVQQKLAAHQKFASMIERDPFTLLLVLRVVPIIPYTPLNYVAGLASIRLPHYVAATAIGMVPSTYIFAFFVQALVDGIMEPRDVAVRGLLAGALFAALVIGTRLAAPRLRRRLDASPDHTTSPKVSADRD